jgi:hypothetical protein
VCDAFDLLHLGSLSGEGAGVRFCGTELAAGGTGLLFGEFTGLLFEEELESSFGQPLSGGGGDLLEGPEVHIEPGSVVPEGSPGNDFGPLPGEFVELLEFLGCESGCRHGWSCLAVTSMTGCGFPIPSSKHRQTPNKP